MSPAEVEALAALRIWGEVRRLAKTAADAYKAKFTKLSANRTEGGAVADMDAIVALPKGPESKLMDLLGSAASVARDITEEAADRLVASAE